MDHSNSGRLDMTRRSALALGATGLLTAVLASCARGTDTLPSPAGVVTLNSDNPTWGPGYAAASKVLDKRIGERIQSRSIASVNNYTQVIRMTAQTDSSTDLIKWTNGYRLQDIARADILTDLNGVWDDVIAKGWVDPAQRESFSYRGKAYGVPLYKSYYAVVYSKKAFAENGIEVPTTFDELLAAAATLKAAGIVPIHSPGANTWESEIWFMQLLASIDPEYYQAVTTNKASYLDAPAAKAMDVWSDMYAQGLFSAPDVTSNDLPGLVKKGSFGMMLYGTWFANSMLAAGLTDADLGFFRVPPYESSTEQAVVVESGSLSVPVKAHRHREAVDVAANWLATDVQEAWVGFLGDTSPNPAALPKSDLVTALATEVAASKPVQLTRYWEASPTPLIEGNVQDLGSFMVNPSKSNGTATLRSMQARATTEWKTWNAA
ncbi:ABC transporter substrate-binding protein [Frigoribacterium sp. 2-23]|uniref:ABC transporter substrate-binding protein n=1 Tax=Frigoribacterium sp. 2-23 TaxID=3415006 RepID=UPI003C6F7E79